MIIISSNSYLKSNNLQLYFHICSKWVFIHVCLIPGKNCDAIIKLVKAIQILFLFIHVIFNAINIDVTNYYKIC